jgi:hypothetical protein
VLHILTALSDNLGTQIKSRNGLKIDGNAFIRPFAAAIFIPLDFLPLGTTESSFVNQVGQLFLHHVVDDLDGLVEAFLACAGHM